MEKSMNQKICPSFEEELFLLKQSMTNMNVDMLIESMCVMMWCVLLEYKDVAFAHNDMWSW